MKATKEHDARSEISIFFRIKYDFYSPSPPFQLSKASQVRFLLCLGSIAGKAPQTLEHISRAKAIIFALSSSSVIKISPIPPSFRQQGPEMDPPP